MHRRTLLLSVPVTLLALVACTNDDEGSGPKKSPRELLDAASKNFVEAKSVSFTLSSKGVPKSANGVTAAKGSGIIDPTTPKFKGEITGTVQGVTGTLDVIAIGEQAWMKFFTPGYNEIDLADVGAPNPARFFHSTEGLPNLLKLTEDLKTGERTREGSEVLTTITGTIPAAPVTELLRLDEGDGSHEVSFGITDDERLRRIVLTGDFFSGKSATYTFVVKDYGKNVEITKP